MEEELQNESSPSSKDSHSDGSTKAEKILGITAKSPIRNTADSDKEARRIHYMKESLKTYEIIKKNIYLGRKKRTPTEDDIFVCDCLKADPADVAALSAANHQISYNCGEKCINRYMCTECEITSCPCEKFCQNRRFQIHKDTKVYPKIAEGKGWGLFAGELIKKGQFIMQYIGEVYSVNCEEAQIRIEAYSKSTCTYLMKISQNEVIDPTFKGNMARFINHSCDPNCITQKWNVLGETCVGIFAIRDIPESVELTFDYQFDSFKTPLTKCLCGSANCKGYLGRKPHELSLEEWEEKLEYLPCSVCGQNVEDDEEKLIQCESCHEAFHIFCLDPPLSRIPKESWWCEKCKVKQEAEEKMKKNLNPLEMNRKLYDTVKKKMGKFHSIEMKNQYQSSDEEDDQPKYTEEYEKIFKLQQRLKIEAMREKYSELYDQEPEDQVRIKKKSKIVPEEGQAAAAGQVTQNETEKEKGKEKDREKDRDKEKEREKDKDREKERDKDKDKERDRDRERERERERDKDKDRDKDKNREKERDEREKDRDLPITAKQEGKDVKPVYRSKVAEFKEKALSIFHEKIKENDLWSQILEVERKNGETYGIYGDRVEIDRRSKMINTIQLDIIKKNQIVFRRIGVRLFWEHHSGRINIYKKNIETTLMGNREQLRIAELVFDLLEFIADEVERMRGQREARIRLPAMFLRKITGAYHNQQAAELENKYEVSIQYSREYLNDECYPLTLMTDMKVKGVKESLIAVHRHINHKVKKLKVRRLYCNRRDYTTLLQNLNIIRRKIHPTELRFNKTKEGALKELNHPFYYIQYKDREVALIGTEREIYDAERILEETFKEAHSGSDEAEFGCVHYLWPTTNMNQQIMQQYKAEIEKEVTGTRFVYFEPIVPRKNMTLSIFGSFKEILRAKEILKEKLELLKSTNLTLEGFQEHVKYQMLKYLFKCLHNFFITNNIADIKFWDLQSVEFEKISDMTPLRKQVLRNIFTKDMNFQIYVLFVCDFSRNQFFNIMKLSTRSTVELLRKFVQNTLNSNSQLLNRMKCESVLRHDRDPSPYSNKKYSGSYSNNYSSRDQPYERGSRRSDERSREKEREASDSRESRSTRNRSRHNRGESQQEKPPRSPYYTSDSYLAVSGKRESMEEYKDEGRKSHRGGYDKGSSSYSEKHKNKDRVPQFSDRYMFEKSQSEKAQHVDMYQDRGQMGRKSESDKGEKRSEEYGRRSESRERSGSRSKRSSFSESASGSQIQNSRSPAQRDQGERRRNEGNQGQRQGYYERNAHYNKDEDYMSTSEQESGHYERRMGNKKKHTGYGRRERESSQSRSRSKSKSQDSRRDYGGRDKQGARSRTRSKDRSRSKERTKRKERSRSPRKGKNRSYKFKSRSRSISGNRNRRPRSKSKSRSRNRNRDSRSSSRERGYLSRNKYGGDRLNRKGKFDVEPQEMQQRQEEQNMKMEETRNQNSAEGNAEGRSESQSISNVDFSKRQYEQPLGKKEEGVSSGNGYQSGEAGKTNGESKQIGGETKDSNSGRFQTSADATAMQAAYKSGQNQKSRFSYSYEMPQEKPQETQQQQNAQGNYYYLPMQQQQIPQYQFSQLPQYQQGGQAQNQIQTQGQNQSQSQPQGQGQPQNQSQPQGQTQTQFYPQMQYSYQFQPQNQSMQQQQPWQFNQYQTPQGQQLQSNQYTYQYKQQTQQLQQQQAPPQQKEHAESVSRFSSKPYTIEDTPKNIIEKAKAEAEEKYREAQYYSKQTERESRENRDFRESRDIKENRDTRGGRDNRDRERDSRDYRDNRERDNRDRERERESRENRDNRDRDSRDYRDVRDIREGRNNPRTYESENYKKNYGQRRHQDSGYGQSSEGYRGRYHEFQGSYGKKIITTKSGMGQSYNSNNFYKDRNKEGGAKGEE